VAVLLAFAVVRLNGTSLWIDEAWSLAATQKLGMSLRATNGTMSAYYAPLWVWARFSTATWWLRLLSTGCGVATLIVVARLGRRVGGSRLAVVAPLLLVGSPMFLWKATEARAYGLETLVTACTWLVMFRGLDAREQLDHRAAVRWSVVLGLLVSLGPLVHGLFIVQMFGLVALLLLGDLKSGLKFIAPAFVACLAVTLVLLATGSKDYGAAMPGALDNLFLDGGYWFLTPVGITAALLTGVLLVGVGWCARSAVRATTDVKRMERALPIAWVAVPVAAILIERAVHGVYAPYYLAPIAPGVALLLGCGALALDDLVLRRRTPTVRRGLLGPVLVATAIVLIVGQARYPRRPVEDWRGAARHVATEARPGDAIVFLGTENVESRTVFEAAWREVHHPVVPIALSPARPLGRVQRVDGFLTSRQIAVRASGQHRIWVVDVHGILDGLHLVDRPPFTTRFHKADDQDFEGGIRVLRYDSSTP
jgi:4-amino-4-deoxy-L-arabinose transferase-like glycosyltransferase